MSAFFSKSRVLILVIVAAIGYFVYMCANGEIAIDKVFRPVEPMTGGDLQSSPAPVSAPTVIETPPISAPAATAPSGYKSIDTVKPADLLPLDMNDRWQKENNLPGLKMPDLMSADFTIGRDSIGQSHKNPNLQTRADPPIPRISGNLWNNSNIDEDRKQMELDIARSEGCRPYGKE